MTKTTKMPNLKDLKRPKKQMINFEITSEEYLELKQRLKDEDVKITDFFRALVHTFLTNK